MNLNQKDIVLLPFPFSDLKTSKVRPAIVISNNKFNRKSDDVIMIPMTTVLKNVSYSITIKPKELSTGKLLKQSRIRVDKIFNVEKNLAIMKIGTINEKFVRSGQPAPFETNEARELADFGELDDDGEDSAGEMPNMDE